MRSRLFFVLFVALALVACTNESDSLTEFVENQNAVNISQLKSMASDAGWSVTSNIQEGDRTTPLTEQEIQVLQEDLDVYSLFPQTAEDRQIEVVLFGNQYIFSPVFVPGGKTKAASSGSMDIYAKYGYCFFSKCNQIPIRICYDLDQSGSICYAFGGSGSNFDGSKPTYCYECRKAVGNSTLYYTCTWGSSRVDLNLWLSRLTYHNVVNGGVDFTTSDRIYLFSSGYADIKTGNSHFETKEISKNELPPEILNPTSLRTIK